MLIYTHQKSKLTKRQRKEQEQILEHQRKIKQELHSMPKYQTEKQVYRRKTQEVPSLDTGIGNATKQDPLMYTGTNMLGISTLHKSNAVPVFSQEEAEDMANMRR